VIYIIVFDIIVIYIIVFYIIVIYIIVFYIIVFYIIVFYIIVVYTIVFYIIVIYIIVFYTNRNKYTSERSVTVSGRYRIFWEINFLKCLRSCHKNTENISITK